MAAKTFLRSVGGIITAITATVTSAGAGNDGDIVALDSTGRIDASMMPTGVAPDVENVVASETISSGALVNLFDNAGTLNVRNADASVSAAGKRADGFVLVGGAASASLNVYFLGRNTAVSGLTKGAVHFLSASTPGGYTTTAPSGSSQLVQSVGVAISATDINVELGPRIVLAP